MLRRIGEIHGRGPPSGPRIPAAAARLNAEAVLDYPSRSLISA